MLNVRAPSTAPNNPMSAVSQNTHDGPMHGWFNLTYASYLVVPRAWIQEMPIDWQQRLRDCLREMEATLDVEEPEGGYRVNCVGANGKYIAHEWNEYRHGPRPQRRAERPLATKTEPLS